jgi:nicotinamidase-related amidase
MWDVHTCKNATRRVAEMAPKLNDFVKAARARGSLIVHSPSDTMKFYEGTPGRKLAQDAPPVKPPEPIQGRRIDLEREGPLPVDDSDWCDDETPCPIPKGGPWPWTRQIATIEIKEGDAVSEKGTEIYNLFQQRGIKNILMTGVHTNMCVLGRSFGIRQMTRVGMNVVLVRDLTDALYNPKKKPYVSHDRGTELIIEHIERNWCPSILSTDVTGKAKIE